MNHGYNEGKQILHKNVRKKRKDTFIQGRSKKQIEKNYKLMEYIIISGCVLFAITLIYNLIS